ncbi:hypothetical protein EDC96DRAFT_278947 [Choanephora cucurbitarum]|nr:hypothetical protein EDC96DRAFT_278947 [Choanephora cucurbitarum]
MHLLSHVGDYIRHFGPMSSTSARSMERSIGILKRTMKASYNVAANNNNILEVGALLDYLDFSGIVNFDLGKKKEDTTYKDHPQDASLPQLWAPFLASPSPISLKQANKEQVIEGGFNIRQLGYAIYQLMGRIQSTKNVIMEQRQLDYNMTIAGKLWKDDVVYYSSLHIDRCKQTNKDGYYALFQANKMCKNK